MPGKKRIFVLDEQFPELKKEKLRIVIDAIPNEWGRVEGHLSASPFDDILQTTKIVFTFECVEVRGISNLKADSYGIFLGKNPQVVQFVESPAHESRKFMKKYISLHYTGCLDFRWTHEGERGGRRFGCEVSIPSNVGEKPTVTVYFLECDIVSYGDKTKTLIDTLLRLGFVEE